MILTDTNENVSIRSHTSAPSCAPIVTSNNKHLFSSTCMIKIFDVKYNKFLLLFVSDVFKPLFVPDVFKPLNDLASIFP